MDRPPAQCPRLALFRDTLRPLGQAHYAIHSDQARPPYALTLDALTPAADLDHQPDATPGSQPCSLPDCASCW